MTLTKGATIVAAGLMLSLLAGCFALESVLPPTVEPSADHSAAGQAPAPAVTKKYRSYINGITCDGLLKTLGSQDGQERAQLAIASFMTGANYAKGRDVNIDLKSLLIMTENYCRQNPASNLTEALITVDKSLDRAQVQLSAPHPATAPPAATNPPAPAAAVAPAPAPAAKPPAPAPAAAVPKPSAPPVAVAKPAAAPAAGTLAPASTAAASLPKASASGNYLVQVISTNVEADANRLIAALQGEKFPAYLEKANLGNKGLWYRVVVGPYDEQPSAEKVAALLRERKFQAMVRLR